MPGDDKATVGKTGDVRIVLLIICISINPNLCSLSNAAGIEELAKDIMTGATARATTATGITPGGKEAAISKARDIGIRLITARIGVD